MKSFDILKRLFFVIFVYYMRLVKFVILKINDLDIISLSYMSFLLLLYKEL